MTDHQAINAYHFTADTLRDGRPLPAIGEELRHHGPVVFRKWASTLAATLSTL